MNCELLPLQFSNSNIFCSCNCTLISSVPATVPLFSLRQSFLFSPLKGSSVMPRNLPSPLRRGLVLMLDPDGSYPLTMAHHSPMFHNKH